MTPLQQADHLVRNHPANKELMELGFGCEFEVIWDGDGYGMNYDDVVAGSERIVWNVNSQFMYTDTFDTLNKVDLIRALDNKDSWCEVNDFVVKILGKPPHLEHYLRVLEASVGIFVFEVNGDTGYARVAQGIHFNLTTGAPATEKDAEAFIKLVS